MPLSEKAVKNKHKYIMEYSKKNYRRVSLSMKFDEYDKLKAAADAAGQPVNGYIKTAIAQRIERDSEKSPQAAANQDDSSTLS